MVDLGVKVKVLWNYITIHNGIQYFVSSPGSGSSSVQINVNDALTFGINGSNLEISSLNAAFPSVNLSNVGTYGAG